MASLRLLLYGGLIFITAIAFPVDKNSTKSSIVFDYNVVPMHYDIKLIIYFKEEDRVYFKDEERVYFEQMEQDDVYKKFKIDIEKHQAKGRFIFYGEFNVTIDIFHPTPKISLNSSSLIYYLSGELIENNTNVKHSVKIFSYYHKTQICDLSFEVDEVPRGNYTLNIKFLNAINTAEDGTIFLKTIYIKKLKSKTWLDATDFQIETQRLFPCWDKPTIRTTFNISIKHHRNFKAFSNMPIRQEEIITYLQLLHNVETYFQWTHFDTTPEMNAHLVVVMLTPLFRSSGTNRIHMWRIPYCAKHIKFAQRIANKVMMKLKFEWFRKLEIPELQLVTISDFQNDTNMNFGLVTIRETNIIYDENVHSVAQKIEVARLIARGVAYQWFGNLISPSWSSYLWLNDGLTTLFGMDALDAVNALENYENSGMLDLFIVQQYESLNSYEWFLTELLSEASSPSEIDLFSSFFRYVKAPLILRMLQHLVTKEVFWKGIRRYLHMQ
ncbi:unnamed protein product [Lasius platythorax]|uniref:Aminopeptidase N n=1 Tax=Lasius platythorax TaxID=488582 RepID=A0AAV2NA51_9HYME